MLDRVIKFKGSSPAIFNNTNPVEKVYVLNLANVDYIEKVGRNFFEIHLGGGSRLSVKSKELSDILKIKDTDTE